jgi:hypothetical protein
MGQVRPVCLGLLLLLGAGVSFGQGRPRWLNGYPGKVFRGAAVTNLRQAEVEGRIEIEAEIPVSANDLLAARLRAPRIADPSQWSVLVIKDDLVAGMFSIQEVTTRPGDGAFDHIRLRARVPVEYSAADFRFYFTVAGRDLQTETDTRIVFGDASLIATKTPKMITSYSIQPAYTNIEGGDRQWVLEFPIRVTFPRPFGEGGAHPIHATLSATPSTQIKDTNSGFVATVGQELTDVYRRSTMLPYLRREWGVRYRSNAQWTNRKTGAYYSFEVPLTSRPVDSGLGYRTQAPALLKLGLLSVEYRERIDTGINPHHTATFLANPWAQVTLPPLYFGGGEHPSPFRHVNLVLSARAWAFPWEEARGGYGVNRFESRFDAELTCPLGGYFGQAFVVGFHTGANENDNYFRQSTVTLEFRIFGKKASLYRSPE